MNASAAPRLLIVDASGYVFRAFFALPPLTRPDGLPVNAVFGFCKMLLKLMQENPDDDIVVVFDETDRLNAEDFLSNKD